MGSVDRGSSGWEATRRPFTKTSSARRLGATRFSVFDGGASGEPAARPARPAYDEARSVVHEECYACPVGRVYSAVRSGAQAVAGRSRPLGDEGEVFGRLVDALAEFLRAGARYIDSLAAGANGLSCQSDNQVQRVSVE